MEEKEIPKGNISLLLAEAQSEKLLARIRFTFASICAFFSLYFFAVNKIDFGTCAIQIGLLIFICLYNGMFLFEAQRRPLPRCVAFLSSFFDVCVITIFIWTFYASGLSAQWIHFAFFPAYFIVIGFTALHNQEALSFFTGIFSVVAYTVLCFIVLLPSDYGIRNWLLFYMPGLVALLIAALISSLISRNNQRSIERITASEGKFSNVGTSLPLMLFKIDKKGKMLWAKTLSNSQFGGSTEKMIGYNIQDFFKDTDVFSLDDLPVQGTFQVKNFIGDMKYVDLVIRADREKSSVYEGSMVDVTDRELAISQREEMEERLFQYKKMESLGTLASGMAHDFNNILQTVTEITDRVKSETAEQPTKRNMELVSETLTDARFLISELLALGRKKPLNYNPINIAQFIREVVPVFSEQIGDLYDVAMNIHEDHLWIQADADYLKRIFQNLFGNARDAMPQGGIITIESFLSDNEGGDRTIVVRFSDTGIGIPKTIAEKIFDPFYTTKKKGKGTGLGLAFVRRIVSLHKGIVFVEKSDSQGTTFRIEIPEGSESSCDVDTKGVLFNRVSTTVLVLDDDPKMCNILDFFLTELSYKTLQASTMEEGLRVLKENLDDCTVLIMDWKLGEKNPHEVITRFRELKPELIIIVVSGYQPLLKSIKKMNIFRWLTKPYDKNRLDLEIQKALYIAARKSS
jgi:signal transduction histidine kinase/ActR/RegA family two-component response regulator